MNMCRHHHIVLWNIHSEDNICFCVMAEDFVRLVPLSYKTSVIPHVTAKRGFPFVLRRIQKDWTFFSGLIVFFVLLWFMSSFVWEITYQGQRGYSRNTLEKTVTQMNVYPGMKRRDLNCDAIEKKLREIYPDISWVSAEEVGSVLKISIKEGKKSITHEKDSKPCHVTALYDGVVQSITVNRGVAAVKKGQKVKKGQILIRGVVPVTDDNEEVVKNNATAAKGTVSLLVEQPFEEEIPVHYQKKEYTGKIIRRTFWRIGNYGFSIKNPLKSFDNSSKYDIITTVCTDRKLHPLSISVRIWQKEYREYHWKKASYDRAGLEKEGKKRYQHILDQYTQEQKELLTHSADLVKKDADHWLLKGKVSFLNKECGSRLVSEEEIHIEKPEGGTNGESGTHS